MTFIDLLDINCGREGVKALAKSTFKGLDTLGFGGTVQLLSLLHPSLT